MEKEVVKIISDVLMLDNNVVNSLSGESNLIDIGLDSIKAIEIIVCIEEKFGITVNEEDLLIDKIDNINKIIGLIKKYNG
mgnify:CR=1 FL=1